MNCQKKECNNVFGYIVSFVGGVKAVLCTKHHVEMDNNIQKSEEWDDFLRTDDEVRILSIGLQAGIGDEKHLMDKAVFFRAQEKKLSRKIKELLEK